MKTYKNSVLKIVELPVRAEKMSVNEVWRVFGGQFASDYNRDAGCTSDCDCFGNKCIKAAGESTGKCSL